MPFRFWAGARAPHGPPPTPAREVKDSLAARLVALTTTGRPQWTPRDYEAMARQGYVNNPIVYRCVRLLAEAAASAPQVVFHDGRRVHDHPLQALLERPNREQGGADLMETFFGGLALAGDAYLEAARGPDGEVTELYALRADRMRVVPGPRGWPEAYDYSVGGQSVRLVRDADGWLPVLHLQLFNPTDDYYGLSPLVPAGAAIDLHNTSSGWNKALLDNAARPSGALVYAPRESGERLSQEQYERLKAELTEAHTGAAGAGRPLLLDGGLDWKPMSLSPADLDFIEGKHAAAREIALAFGVPPQLLGIPGDNTYANFKEANAAFWRFSVAPLAERAARSIGAWLAPKFPGVRVGIDLDAMPALSAERDALWSRLDAASFLTDAERRRMAGLGEHPEGES